MINNKHVPGDRSPLPLQPLTLTPKDNKLSINGNMHAFGMWEGPGLLGEHANTTQGRPEPGFERPTSELNKERNQLCNCCYSSSKSIPGILLPLVSSFYFVTIIL